jgi:hypothetical protein
VSSCPPSNNANELLPPLVENDCPGTTLPVVMVGLLLIVIDDATTDPVLPEGTEPTVNTPLLVIVGACRLCVVLE